MNTSRTPEWAAPMWAWVVVALIGLTGLGFAYGWPAGIISGITAGAVVAADRAARARSNRSRP